MSTVRSRSTPEASRTAALDAARALLVERGPQGVTLKAVAERVGRTHANLLHHFGSAGELQSALAARMAEEITRRIADAVLQARAGEIDARVIVDLTFDAFDGEGAAALASWMILNGNRTALDPVLDAIARLVDRVGPFADRPVRAITLSLVLTALGDALLGAPMAERLGLARTSARETALVLIFPDYRVVEGSTGGA